MKHITYEYSYRMITWNSNRWTIISWVNDILHGLDQRKILKAIIRTTSFPLWVHAVHIAETGKGICCQEPLRMIVCFEPRIVVYLDRLDVFNCESLGAPCRSQGPSPCLGEKWWYCEIICESVFKDTAVNAMMLEDSLYSIPEYWSEIVKFEKWSGLRELAKR